MHTGDQTELPAFLQPIAMKWQIQNDVAGPVVPEVKIARSIVNISLRVRQVSSLKTSRLAVGADGVVPRVIGTVV